MPIRTKRWNDPVEQDDGFRLLICRYRPRGVPKASEPWNASCPALSPSQELHAAFYGKSGPAISFEEYKQRFLLEMQGSRYWINGFAERVRAGGMLTLLCSSACTDETRCHRILVRDLLEAALETQTPARVRRRPGSETD